MSPESPNPSGSNNIPPEAKKAYDEYHKIEKSINDKDYEQLRHEGAIHLAQSLLQQLNPDVQPDALNAFFEQDILKDSFQNLAQTIRKEKTMSGLNGWEDAIKIAQTYMRSDFEIPSEVIIVHSGAQPDAGRKPDKTALMYINAYALESLIPLRKKEDINFKTERKEGLIGKTTKLPKPDVYVRGITSSDVRKELEIKGAKNLILGGRIGEYNFGTIQLEAENCVITDEAAIGVNGKPATSGENITLSVRDTIYQYGGDISANTITAHNYIHSGGSITRPVNIPAGSRSEIKLTGEFKSINGYRPEASQVTISDSHIENEVEQKIKTFRNMTGIRSSQFGEQAFISETGSSTQEKQSPSQEKNAVTIEELEKIFEEISESTRISTTTRQEKDGSRTRIERHVFEVTDEDISPYIILTTAANAAGWKIEVDKTFPKGETGKSKCMLIITKPA